MSVTRDIVQSWRHPRLVLRQHLQRPRAEAFAFALLLVFLILAFVAQWPVAARQSYEAGTPSVMPRLLALALAVAASIPVWYGLAALSHLVARAFGGKGSWYGCRMALFAALVAVSPLLLLQGLTAGMIGPGNALIAVQVLVGAGFLYLWISMLIEAER
jgi:hypothetical protein